MEIYLSMGKNYKFCGAFHFVRRTFTPPSSILNPHFLLIAIPSPSS